jgi:hypothetical protein
MKKNVSHYLQQEMLLVKCHTQRPYLDTKEIHSEQYLYQHSNLSF